MKIPTPLQGLPCDSGSVPGVETPGFMPAPLRGLRIKLSCFLAKAKKERQWDSATDKSGRQDAHHQNQGDGLQIIHISQVKYGCNQAIPDFTNEVCLDEHGDGKSQQVQTYRHDQPFKRKTDDLVGEEETDQSTQRAVNEQRHVERKSDSGRAYLVVHRSLPENRKGLPAPQSLTALSSELKRRGSLNNRSDAKSRVPPKLKC